MTRAEILELASLLKKLGEETKPEEEGASHGNDVGGKDNVTDFYLPRVPQNFYYDPKVFRKLLGIK